jgi:RNA polymerase subunit RPABC4/transcription elongation factor Spt4
MTVPSLEALTSILTVFAAALAALLAALWLSLIIWAFRDMRARSRDPFAQFLAALVVAALPGAGIIIYFILRPPETLIEAYERALEEEALLQEIEERPSCPGCSRTMEKNWLLCPYCHTRLRKACRDCNALLELNWNLCPYCGNQKIDPYKADVIRPGQIGVNGEPEAESSEPETTST